MSKEKLFMGILNTGELMVGKVNSNGNIVEPCIIALAPPGDPKIKEGTVLLIEYKMPPFIVSHKDVEIYAQSIVAEIKKIPENIESTYNSFTSAIKKPTMEEMMKLNKGNIIDISKLKH